MDGADTIITPPNMFNSWTTGNTQFFIVNSATAFRENVYQGLYSRVTRCLSMLSSAIYPNPPSGSSYTNNQAWANYINAVWSDFDGSGLANYMSSPEVFAATGTRQISAYPASSTMDYLDQIADLVGGGHFELVYSDRWSVQMERLTYFVRWVCDDVGTSLSTLVGDRSSSEPRQLLRYWMQNAIGTGSTVASYDTTQSATRGTRYLHQTNGALVMIYDDASAVTTERPNYTDNTTTNTIINNQNTELHEYSSGDTLNYSPIIYGDNGTVQYYDFTNGTYQDVDYLTYNAGDKTYTVNNNYYITNNYNYTYYIAIGESAEYVGAYEVYFELPDGRNSKDLTADEIYGLDGDVGWVNFDVANENPDLIGLWPMDGSLENTAVGDAALAFTQGASSEFLETDNFGGALYVPYGAVSTLSYAGTSYLLASGASQLGAVSLTSSVPSSGTLQFRSYFVGNLSSPYSRLIASFGDSSPALSGGYSSTKTDYSKIELWSDSATTAHFRYYYLDASNQLQQFNTPSFVISGVWNDICIQWSLPVFTVSDPSGYFVTIRAALRVSIWVNGALLSSFSGGYSGVHNVNRSTTFYTFLGASPAFSLTTNTDFGGFQYDNVRLLEGNLFDMSAQNIPVAGQPFDSNKVLVLPEDTSSLTVPTIAVYSDIPIGETRIGGVRPSIPSRGDVYCYVEDNRITSVQQYDGSGWLETGGMIWTGTRWVDPSAYDIVNYADLFDVVDPLESIQDSVDQTNSILEQVLSVLTDLRNGVFERLDSILEALGVSGGGSEEPGTDPDNPDNTLLTPLNIADQILSALLSVATAALIQFIQLVADLFATFINALIDFVGGIIGVIVSAVGSIPVLLSPLTGLGSFIGDCWSVIPSDLQAVLGAAFTVVVAVALIGFFL